VSLLTDFSDGKKGIGVVYFIAKNEVCLQLPEVERTEALQLLRSAGVD
jgi:hypothetical protein